MKTIIKLIITLAVLNAIVRSGQAAWSYYQLKDAAHQALIFGAGATTAQLHDQILAEAAALALPLQPEDLAVTRTGSRTVAEARYTQLVEWFPSIRRPVALSFVVDAVAATSAPAGPP